MSVSLSIPNVRLTVIAAFVDANAATITDSAVRHQHFRVLAIQAKAHSCDEVPIKYSPIIVNNSGEIIDPSDPRHAWVFEVAACPWDTVGDERELAPVISRVKKRAIEQELTRRRQESRGRR